MDINLVIAQDVFIGISGRYFFDKNIMGCKIDGRARQHSIVTGHPFSMGARSDFS